MYLAETGVSYASLWTYLSKIHFLQISNGLADPCLGAYPMLEYMIHGLCRSPKKPSWPRLPITPDILRLLFISWSRAPHGDNYDITMLWAACCEGFFEFMWAGEFNCLSLQAFDHSKICPQDIAMDSHYNQTMVTIHLRQRRTHSVWALQSIWGEQAALSVQCRLFWATWCWGGSVQAHTSCSRMAHACRSNICCPKSMRHWPVKGLIVPTSQVIVFE